jgi:hypothetical protein
MGACPSAGETGLKHGFTMLVKNRVAVSAAQERPPSLDGENGNKEKVHVLVRPSKGQGRTAAIGACSGLSFQGDCARPDASDEEKHPFDSGQTLLSWKT